MMVNCPKCGFSQPDDQYCANCGVDMHNFRPTRVPLLRRLVTSVPFQLAVLLVVIVAGFSYIRYRVRLAGEERSAQIENARPVRLEKKKFVTADAASQTSPEDAQNAAPSVTPSEHGQYPNGPASGTTPGSAGMASLATQPDALPAEGSRTLSVPASGAPSAANPAASASPSMAGDRAGIPSRLQVHFVEINRSALNELLGEVRGTSGYGSFASGVVPNTAPRLRQLKESWKNLEPMSSQGLVSNQPILIFKGLRDESSGQDLGLTLQLTPSAIDETGIQLQIEALRVLRDPGATPPISEQTFQEQFTIPRGGSALLLGTLPHRTSLPEDDSRLYANSPVLRVLNSPSFQSGASEFVILIEPK